MSPLRAPSTICVLTLILGLFCGIATPDIIHLKSGQQARGKIIESRATEIIVETKFGVMTFERSKIERIEYQRLPKEEVAARRIAAKGDAAALYEVALFAKEQKLDDEYLSLLEEVLKFDPRHIDANQLLGKIRYEGQWYTPEELEAEKQQVAEKMKAAGKAFYRGKWLREETVKRLKGFELYKGNWLPWKEIYTLQAQENMEPMLGVNLEIRTSDHFALRSELSEESQKELLDLLEAGFAHFSSYFKPDEIEANIMDFYPITIYVLPNANLVTKFVEPDGYMQKLYNPPRGVIERYVDANSFPIFFPRPLIVISEGRHNKGAKSRTTSMTGFISHYTGNLLVRRFKRGGMVPGWVECGLSHYYEGMLNGFQTLSITEYVGFDHIEKWDIKLQDFLAWYKQMVDPEFRKSLPPLSTLKSASVEEIEARGLVKCYFLATWLMETKPQAFVNYIRECFRERGEFRVRTKEADAFQQAFEMTPDEMDAEFEKWATSLEPHPPVD